MSRRGPQHDPPDDRWLISSRRIARSAAFRAGGEVAGKLASMAFFVVMARELGRDGFGSFMFALSLATILMFASGLGTEELIAREVARDRRRVDEYLADVVAMKLAISIPLLVVAVAVAEAGGFSGDAVLAVGIVGAGVAIENLGRTFHAVFTAIERLEMISISLVLQRTVTAAVGIGLLLAGGGLVVVSIVFATGAVIGLVVAARVLRRFVAAPRWQVDRSRWGGLVRAALPVGLGGLLITVLLRLDATLLGLLTGDAAEVGVYGAAFRLVEATLFISWAFAASTLPWLARQEEAAAVARGFELGAKLTATLLMPVALCFIFLAPQLIDVLYGPGYGAAVLPLRLLGILTVLYGIGNFAFIVLLARDRPRPFAIAVSFVVVENIALNVLLIPRYGADAAAFNATLSIGLLAATGVTLVIREVGRVRLLRAFAAPAAASAAMGAVVLALPGPAPAAVAAGLGAYIGTAIAIERLLFPQDLARVRSLLAGVAASPPARNGR